MKTRNIVKKYMDEFNHPKVIPNKKKYYKYVINEQEYEYYATEQVTDEQDSTRVLQPKG